MLWALAVTVLSLHVTASAGTLHEVLAAKAQHYGDLIGLRTQLSLIIDGSRKLLETRAAIQGLKSTSEARGRQLLAGNPGTNLDDLLRSTSRSLKTIERVAVSHPILAILSRRTFLACVALQWILLGQKPLDDDVDKKLTAVTSEFYRIHVRSVLRRGLMEYLHISKSGGTSFSAAAKLSKCSMAPGIGQLEELGDLPRWIDGRAFEEVTDGTDIMWSFHNTDGRPPEGQSCARRVAHLAAAGYAYVSNEFTLHGGGDGGAGMAAAAAAMRSTHLCPQAVNVVTLRHPDGRLASHLHYMLARVKKRLLGKSDFDLGDFFDTFCAGDVRTWERVAPTVIDNYCIRSFIGERAFHSPLGSIGAPQLEVARRLLLQFDLVLDLDAGEDAADLTIQQGLGWDVSMAELRVRTSSRTFTKLNYSKEECPNVELLKILLPRQAPDRALYSTGRTLAFLDTLFLDVARAVGLRPKELADSAAAAGSGASLTVAAARKAANAKDKASAGGGGGGGSRVCGLLHAPSVAGPQGAAQSSGGGNGGGGGSGGGRPRT